MNQYYQALLDWLRFNRVGDSHVHSNFSECGKDIDLSDLVRVSEANDLPITLTDHSSHLMFGLENAYFLMGNDTSNQSSTLFLKHSREAGIERIQDYVKHFQEHRSAQLRLGVELDITEDGLLLFPSELIDHFGFFNGHVNHLKLNQKLMGVDPIINEWKFKTKSLIQSRIDVLAHPLRVLAAKQIDFPLLPTIEWLVEQAENYQVALEINSHYQLPEIDLVMVKAAAAAGVKLAIGTDSHLRKELLDFSYHSAILEQSNIRPEEFDRVLYQKNNVRKIDVTRCWYYKKDNTLNQGTM